MELEGKLRELQQLQRCNAVTHRSTQREGLIEGTLQRKCDRPHNIIMADRAT